MRFALLLTFVSVSVHLTAQKIDLERGLVAYYSFSENAEDQTSNENHGEVRGAKFEPETRCKSGGYFFDGIDDYIDCGNDESLNGDFRGLTISVMIKSTEEKPEDFRLIAGKWAFDARRDQFAIFLNISNKISFSVADGAEFGYGVYSKKALVPHEWYHVVCAWNRSGKVGIFINGRLDNIGDQHGRGLNPESNISLKIGRQVIGQDRPYNGYIDELRIYNRTLGTDEIKALYLLDNSACNQFVLKGTVRNKKTDEPIGARISFEDMETGEEFISTNSDSVTGYYEMKLPIGYRYGFYAASEGYIAINENVNTSNVKHNAEIEKDLYLVPIEVGSTVKLNNLFFDFNKASIKKESFLELERLLKLFDEIPGLIVEIGGHTDAVGSDEYNQNLSEQRANAVRDYLMENNVEEQRVVAVGYGETTPVATNDTDEGRQLNRRVEFKILSTDNTLPASEEE